MRDLITIGLLAGILYLCLALPLSVLIGQKLRRNARRLEKMLRMMTIVSLPWVALGVTAVLVCRRNHRRRRRLAAIGAAYLHATRPGPAPELPADRAGTWLLLYPTSHTQIVAHLRRVQGGPDA